MSLEAFRIMDTNPNENSGGGGCLCSNGEVTECKGPYVVFTNVDTDCYVSPFCVLGAACAKAAGIAVGGEVLAGGERGPEPVEVSAVEVVDDVVEDDDSIPDV